MVTIRRSIVEETDALLELRKETLCKVNNLEKDYEFDSLLIEFSRGYFLNGNQTTVVAEDEGTLIGCASLSYVEVMPTLMHPTGIRAHLMNVYVREQYRRQGIARQMIKLLIVMKNSRSENKSGSHWQKEEEYLLVHLFQKGKRK